MTKITRCSVFLGLSQFLENQLQNTQLFSKEGKQIITWEESVSIPKFLPVLFYNISFKCKNFQNLS
jgi:hypothetical protein